MTWPNKVYSRSMVPIYTRANDSGMLFRYKGPVRNGKILDVSGNGNDSSSYSGFSSGDLGLQSAVENSSIYSPITTATVAANSAYTMGAFVDKDKLAAATYGMICGVNFPSGQIQRYGGIHYGASGITLIWYNGSVYRSSTVSLNKNLKYHSLYCLDTVNNAGYLYINSVSAATIATIDVSVPGAAQNYVFGVATGYNGTTARSPLGLVTDGTLWNRTLTAADIRKEWIQYAQMVQFKTGWGAKVSVANENTVGAYVGQGSSPFEILSGTWKVSTTTIDGELHKVLECVAAGTVWLDRCFMNINSSEAAYGGWRFRIYHAASATPTTIGFTATAKNTPAVTTGYYLRVYDTQTRLGYYNAGSYTDLTSWGTGGGATETLDIQVGRRYDGAFQYSYRRLSQPWTSTGTYTNTTYTTSEGMSINANAGDLISLGTVRDNATLIKYLGEFLPTEV